MQKQGDKEKEYNPEGTHSRINKIAEIKEIAAQKKGENGRQRVHARNNKRGSNNLLM